MSEILRFFAVTVLGVVLDIAMAYALHSALGWPLWLAAASGFVIAAGANYAIHQTWTFRAGPRRLSLGRAARYGAVALVTLLARLAAVAALAPLAGPDLALGVLIAGAGVSFCVNFTLSKLFVFRGSPARGQAA
jgi:putative flippase GtrA